jgi:hypothetical protein
VHQPEQAAEVIIGVDTHKDTHTAVALDTLGTRLGTNTIVVSREGYRQIEAWARSFGSVRAFGIECTGSYGAGLSRALQASGYRVVDVNRADRSARRRHGSAVEGVLRARSGQGLLARVGATDVAGGAVGSQEASRPGGSLAAGEVLCRYGAAAVTAGTFLKEVVMIDLGLDSGKKLRKPRGRKDADKQEAVTKPQVVEKRIVELVQLHIAAHDASEAESDAIKKCAEDSGYNASAIKKFIVARAGDKFLEKKRDCEQQMELFEEVGEK